MRRIVPHFLCRFGIHEAMPKSSNHLALARQWEMLKLLPGRAPGLTARELTERLKEAGYEVSKRTVERDLNDLSMQFGIVCNDAAMPYGWHWLPGQQAAFGSVDLVDALTLSLTENVLRQMLPRSMLGVLEPKFQQARTKLAALSEQLLARLGEKVRYVSPSFHLQAPTIRPKLFFGRARHLLGRNAAGWGSKTQFSGWGMDGRSHRRR